MMRCHPFGGSGYDPVNRILYRDENRCGLFTLMVRLFDYSNSFFC